jgi:hypothetical protein
MYARLSWAGVLLNHCRLLLKVRNGVEFSSLKGIGKVCKATVHCSHTKKPLRILTVRRENGQSNQVPVLGSQFSVLSFLTRNDYRELRTENRELHFEYWSRSQTCRLVIGTGRPSM